MKKCYKKAMRTVVITAITLGVPSAASAEFRLGVEGGIDSTSVDHSFDFSGGSFSGGVSCGSLDVVEDAISSPVGVYGHWTKADDGIGWGIRGGYYSAGSDANVIDLLLMGRGGVKDEFDIVGGIGFSRLTVDVTEPVNFVGLCTSIVNPIILPPQEYEFSGFKLILGMEKPIVEKVYWTLTGTYAGYNSKAVNIDGIFETTIEPSIFTLTTGVVFQF